MKHGIERLNRLSGPEVTGVDRQKIKKTVLDLAYRVGQRGKTINEFKMLVDDFFSSKELHYIDGDLYKYSLKIKKSEKIPNIGTEITVVRIIKQKRGTKPSIKCGGMSAWH